MNKAITLTTFFLTASAVKVEAGDVFSDIAGWFEHDFVDFWENDFADFWTDDFVNFWEEDFVNFWEDDFAGAFEDLGGWIDEAWSDWIDFYVVKKDLSPDIVFDYLFDGRMSHDQCITKDCLHPCYAKATKDNNPCQYCAD